MKLINPHLSAVSDARAFIPLSLSPSVSPRNNQFSTEGETLVFNKFPREILFVPAAIELWATGRPAPLLEFVHPRASTADEDGARFPGAESDGPFASAVRQGDIS